MERSTEMSDGTSPIFLSAGDPSGDIAGHHLIKQLQSGQENLEFFGLGGQRMLSVAQNQIVNGDRLAVIGFWEVAKEIFFFRKLMSDTVRLIEEKAPKVIVLIDYPGFNLRLAERVKPLGIPIVYYISPQIWAWGGRRIEKIRRLVDLMLLILPFEKEIYDRAGINNRFVGHYLLDDIDERYIKAPYNPDSDLVVLMPGSRPQEVHKMLPVLLDMAEILSLKKSWRFTIAAVGGDIDYNSYLRTRPLAVEVVRDRTRELIRDSRLVVTSSGTSTLEAGIIGRPMMVIYKTGWLTYMIARGLVKVDKIALINITAGEKVVPEFIQYDAVPGEMAAQARRLLDNPELSLNIIKRLNSTTDLLGSPGASARAAEAVREFIG